MTHRGDCGEDPRVREAASPEHRAGRVSRDGEAPHRGRAHRDLRRHALLRSRGRESARLARRALPRAGKRHVRAREQARGLPLGQRSPWPHGRLRGGTPQDRGKVHRADRRHRRPCEAHEVRRGHGGLPAPPPALRRREAVRPRVLLVSQVDRPLHEPRDRGGVDLPLPAGGCRHHDRLLRQDHAHREARGIRRRVARAARGRPRPHRGG